MDSEHLEAYLSGELDETGRRQVEHALRHDADLRASFVSQAQMEAALRVLLGPDGEEKQAFERGVLARLRGEGAGDRGFAKSVLLEIVEEREGQRPIRWPDLVATGLISAAASIGLLLLLQSIIFRPATGPAAPRGENAPVVAFGARVERAEDLRWDAPSAARVRPDGWLPAGLLRLESGNALIAFNSGATALVEGPAEFSVESNNRLFLKRGRLAADVPPKATGFTVNTPRLNAVDLGTRFGVSVDREGNSELHVMEGFVAASRTSGNAVATVVAEGLAVVADGRTRNELKPLAYGGDRFRLRLGTPVTARPEIRFAFDESAGAILEDTGSERLFDIPLVASGELDRSPRRSAGRVGGALVFQPGETLDAPLTSGYRLEEAHTLAFWVKLPAQVGPSEQGQIVAYGSEGRFWRVSCNLEASAGVRGAVRVACGEAYAIGGTDIADGNWHHVAYRYLGGGGLGSGLQLYIDGKPETFSHLDEAGPIGGRAGNLRLGGGIERGFRGWIDELCLFREAVPTRVIQELSDEGDPADPADLAIEGGAPGN